MAIKQFPLQHLLNWVSMWNPYKYDNCVRTQGSRNLRTTPWRLKLVLWKSLLFMIWTVWWSLLGFCSVYLATCMRINTLFWPIPLSRPLMRAARKCCSRHYWHLLFPNANTELVHTSNPYPIDHSLITDTQTDPLLY